MWTDLSKTTSDNTRHIFRFQYTVFGIFYLDFRPSFAMDCLFEIQSKIKLGCFQTRMSSVSHYCKLKEFECHYNQILKLRPIILTACPPVKNGAH